MTLEEWAGSLGFLPMTPSVAREIADKWCYPPPYDFYDQTADPDDYQEFITETDWPTHFWQVRSQDQLVGFFSAHLDEARCEIALGLHPALTGTGRGLAFLQAGLVHLAPLLTPGCEVVLDVAEFNQRAIRVYERAGFKVTRRFNQDTNGATFPFLAMTLAPLH
jgi:ribosomal-protein-alanine N-acetyltransferase